MNLLLYVDLVQVTVLLLFTHHRQSAHSKRCLTPHMFPIPVHFVEYVSKVSAYSIVLYSTLNFQLGDSEHVCLFAGTFQVHGNVCVDSVVVTPTLDWKLHAFDVLSEFDGGNPAASGPMLVRR